MVFCNVYNLWFFSAGLLRLGPIWNPTARPSESLSLGPSLVISAQSFLECQYNIVLLTLGLYILIWLVLWNMFYFPFHIYIYGMSSFQGLGSVQPLDGVRFCRAVTVCHSLSGATKLVPRVYTVIANIAATLCSARPGPYLSCPIHCRSID